jgi:hypothetical protein
VNKLELDPAVDKAAIYKLTKSEKNANLRFAEWKELESGYKYGPIAVIGGQLYVALGPQIVPYDYDENRFADMNWQGHPEPAYVSEHGVIVGMAVAGASLWILTQDNTLAKIDWKERQEVESWNLGGIGLQMPKGLTFGRSEFFVVEGNHPNPIHVLRFATPPSFSRAGWLGGWPRACP